MPIQVELVPGGSVVCDLVVVQGGSIDGVVQTRQSEAVVGALVRVVCDPPDHVFPDGSAVAGASVWRFDRPSEMWGGHPATHWQAWTDSGGRYRFVGLPPGRHRLEVLAPGLSYEARDRIEVRDGRGSHLDHYLEPAGTIQGVDPRPGYLAVTREGRERVLMLAKLPDDGRFAFGGLAAGRYVLSRFHPGPGPKRDPLATVDVEAGRATWIDLSRSDLPVRFLGRVVDAGKGVAGVRVRIESETFTTDDAGRFEMWSSFSLAGPIRARVLRDAVETAYSLPAMPEGVTTFEKELALGGESILVRTVDADGARIPARLEIAARRLDARIEDVESLRFDPVFVDESGECTIAGLFPGEYSLRARFENGSETNGTVALPGTTDFELRMPPSGDLTVRVREAEGAPGAGRWVSVEAWSAVATIRSRGDAPSPHEFEPPRWGETDIHGRVTFHGIRAGEVLVRVLASRRGRPGLESTLAERRVTIGAGAEESIAIELP